MNTYRLQLSAEHGLHAAAHALGYLSHLGVTAAYTSPYFMAGAESSGYDVCDHARIQPELGGAEGLERFVQALRHYGLGHVIDVVPNHMGVDAVRNRWWRDVLQHGARSAFAGYFDIDWDPVKPELRGRILLPILDKSYGAALTDGDIRLVRENGEFIVQVRSQHLPVRPGSVADDTPPELLTTEELHTLLERQVYRLAYWRTASDEINYRRFFDIDGLIGLRVEEEEVFCASHKRLAQLIADGIVTAIRVDHPDGLARPAEYFRRLRALQPAPDQRTLHVVAEKILTNHERLPEDWAIDGTTGYEFLNLLNGLFVQPAGAHRLRRLYARVTRRAWSFDDECYQSKKAIMASTMVSEVQMLAHRLNRISERQPGSRDFTLNSVRRALMEIVACLSVYRTYITAEGASADDISRIRRAASLAMTRNPALESSAFRFVVAVLLTTTEAEERCDYPPADALDVADRARFVERLQQFTGSVFAKGVEDTAFYRYQPLLSLNEVGGNPGAPGCTPSTFHASNQWRAAHAPRGLLATATHDTKLGEDARARINVLSELPDEWGQMVSRWRRLARASQSDRTTRRALDTNDVYRFFQAVVGTWPFDDERDATGGAYVERLVSYMRKSVREAKTHTSWLNPNEGYEAAMSSFIRDAIARVSEAPGDDPGRRLLMRIARTGVVNSLAQLVLKLGGPGVVDVYQGAELWGLTLVDPDNRRPVDFARRQRMLEDLEPLLSGAKSGEPGTAERVRQLLDDWSSGAIKLFVTAAGLRLRRDHSDLFVGGRYEPLEVNGSRSDHVVAYARRVDNLLVIVVGPRLVSGLMDDNRWPLGGAAWGSTTLSLPDARGGEPFRNVLTGETLRPALSSDRLVLQVDQILRFCPVGILLG